MSLFKTSVIAAFLLLGGCGFSPVYGTHASSAQPAMQHQLDDVEIGMIANREGQYLRNALLDQMGSATALSAGQRYFLHVYNLAEDDQSFGIRKDASATRGDITITATMDLIDTTTNTVVLTRPLRTRAGYNRMDNLYGVQVSRQDTVDRLLDEMANRAVTELTLYFDRKG